MPHGFFRFRTSTASALAMAASTPQPIFNRREEA
jgi:hypothetical protein